MNNIPAELRHAQNHEWVRPEADGSVTVDISDHAQEALDDAVFIELSELGKALAAGQEVGVAEPVKAASDVYSPVGGEVIVINETLADAPEGVNNDPYASWFFRPKPNNPAEPGKLSDTAGYQATINAEG